MKNLATALMRAQSEMGALVKTTKGEHGKYATLADVQDVCYPALRNHGIVVFQSVGTEILENGSLVVRVSCTLYHAESGENLVNEIVLPPTKNDARGVGSAITYARRYILTTMVGLAPEDDDGQSASNNHSQSSAAVSKSAQPKAVMPVKAAAPTIFDDFQPCDKWLNGTEAKKVAVDEGWCANEFEAKNSLLNSLQEVTGQKEHWFPARQKEVFRNFYEKHMVWKSESLDKAA